MDVEKHQELIDALVANGVGEHAAREALACLGGTSDLMARRGLEFAFFGGFVGLAVGFEGVPAGALIGGTKGMISGALAGIGSIECGNWNPEAQARLEEALRGTARDTASAGLIKGSSR